eukprot:g2072.t2
MGVRGLSSYVSGCQRACSEHVDLNAGANDDASTANEPLWLAVDGLALVYHVMQNAGSRDLHLDLGCDYGSLHDALLEYLSALTRAGVGVLVVVDGMQDTEKEATTLERRCSQAAEASTAMTSLSACDEGRRRNGDSPGSSSSSDPSLQQQQQRRRHLQQACASLLPLFAAETLVAACRSAGVPVRAADREADPELTAACRRSPSSSSSSPSASPSPTPEGDRSHASEREEDGERRGFRDGVGAVADVREAGFAAETAATGRCDAVLSNDSDFLVVDIPGYIPFWSLGVGADGSAGALVFRRSLVAARLGIPGDRMADLACLVGNDWIAPEERVHRVMQEAAATGGGRNNGPKKKRKAGAATRPRNDGAGSSSHGSAGNGSGASTSAAASAKDLVEVTARYLADFLRRDVSTAISSNDVYGSGDGDGGACGTGSAALSARRLCATFFPTLLVGDDDDDCKNNNNEDGEDENDDGATEGSRGGGALGGQQRQLERRGPHPPRLPPPPPPQGAGVRTSDCLPPPAVAAAASTIGSTTGTDGVGSARVRARAKKSKGRNKKSRRHDSNDGKSGGRSECGVGRAPKDSDGRGEKGGGARREPCGGLGAAAAHAEEFLRNFLSARRHFETPAGGAEVDKTVAEVPCSSVIYGAETATVGRAPRGVVLSSVGLRAGIQAPPELAQAVLEGVFWCRVMMEDSTTCSNHLAGAAVASDNGGTVTNAGDSAGPAAEAPAHTAFSSAFSTFSDVRKRLYELCLAQLAAARTPAHGGTRGRDGDDFLSGSSERFAGTTPDDDGGDVPVPPAGTGKNGERERGPGTGKRHDGHRGLAEGDEWVVREFRRAGASVKPVRVACRVPPSSSWLPLDSSLPRRLNVCLMALGLAFRDNRLLMKLMSNEVRQPTESSRNSGTAGETAPPPLTAVALVAALLISTNAPATSSSSSSSSAPTPAPRSPWRDASRPFKAGSVSSPGDDDDDDDGDMIIPVFVAAATSCCCRPTEGSADKDGDWIDSLFIEGNDATPSRNPVAETSASAPGDGEQFSWCQVLHESLPDKAGDKEEHGHQGGRHHEKEEGEEEEEEEEEEEDGPSGGKVRRFINSWSKVQSAVWHVNTCLAVLGLTTPAAAADGGGGGGGDIGGSRGIGGALSPMDPLRLRPALALALFRRRKRLRRLCDGQSSPVAGKQPVRRQPAARGGSTSPRSQWWHEQRQHHVRQQRQRQQRVVAGGPAPGEGARGTVVSRNGTSGSLANPPTAKTWGGRYTFVDLYLLQPSPHQQMAAASSSGDVLLDTTVAVSIATFARLAHSADFFRSTRSETKFTKQEVVNFGEWVPWEFQSEGQESPSNSDSSEEVVPDPPPEIEARTTTTPSGREGGGPEQMYRKIRLRSTVSSPLGSSYNDGVQGQTLREGDNEVIYTETDCVTGLPMFRGDMAIKTTYRVVRDDDDPDNSVHVKVTVFLRDVKLARAMGWLSKLVQKSIKDSAKSQAAHNLKKMVEAKTTLGAP